MKFNKNKKWIGFISFLFIAITGALTVDAQEYIPLEPLTESAGSGVTLSTYLNDAFKIGVGIAGVFAVLMIVIGGISYIGGASNPSARSEAKNKITNAIFGLILAIASWLILSTINPDLLKTEVEFSTVSTMTTTGEIGDTTVTAPETEDGGPGEPCGSSEGSSCVEGSFLCPSGSSRDWSGRSCISGYICCG